MVSGPHLRLRYEKEVLEILGRYVEQLKLGEVMKEFMERDEATGLHVTRVSAVAMDLALERGRDDQLISIGAGALLHDIGKMDVPLEILRNKNKLSGKDWEIMKSHATMGVERLESDPRLAEARKIPFIREVIGAHHELKTIDPYGVIALKDLPKEARDIVSVVAAADVFDALSNDRSYQKAQTMAKAVYDIMMGTENIPQDLTVSTVSRFRELKEQA